MSHSDTTITMSQERKRKHQSTAVMPRKRIREISSRGYPEANATQTVGSEEQEPTELNVESTSSPSPNTRVSSYLVSEIKEGEVYYIPNVCEYLLEIH